MDRILIILKKENGPRASSAPALGLNTIIFKHVVMYDSYLLKDVHSVLVNFPREYAQESMMLYI